MRITKWSIGTDPELFLEKDGVIVSAEGLIGGTKQDPFPISKDGHFIQEDNVMVEFNVPPSENAEDFITHINFVKEHLETLASLKGMKLNYSTSAKLTKEELSTPQGSMFGCEPSWNFYLKDTSPTPDSKSEWRSCGGHIHVGYNNPDQDTSERIIFAMDLVLGLQSILLDPNTIRRESYGKAGEFRWKDFGVEYRTLSNFWIKNDEMINWAYESTALAIELVNSEILDKFIDEYEYEVRDAINNSDKAASKTILDKLSKVMEEVKIKTQITVN